MHARILSAAIAAACLPLSPGAAQPADTRTEIVSFADLDLATPAGVARLDARIRAAVDAACGPTSDADPAGKNRAARCRRALLADAAAQRSRALAAAANGARTELAAKR